MYYVIISELTVVCIEILDRRYNSAVILCVGIRKTKWPLMWLYQVVAARVCLADIM